MGAATPSRTRSTSVVPPARNALAGSALTAATASATSVGPRVAQRPHRLSPRVRVADLADRRADVRDTPRSGRCCRSCTRRSPRRSSALPSSSSATADMIWPGGAVAALEGVVFDERLLHRMQRPSSSARPSIVVTSRPSQRDRECQAGQHPPPVDPDRAGAAGALVAALLGAGQLEVLAQRVEQAHPRFEVDHVSEPLMVSVKGTRPRSQSACRLATANGDRAIRPADQSSVALPASTNLEPLLAGMPSDGRTVRSSQLNRARSLPDRR